MDRCRLPILALAVACCLPACVRRSLEINSQPQGALVYVNDEEVGRTPTTVPFTWYGTYDVRLVKPGYQTLHTSRQLKAPLSELPGPDLLVEVLPWTTHYRYSWQFQLQPAQPVSEQSLIDRSAQLRALLDVPVKQLPAD